MKKGYIPKDKRKTILMLSDDIRTSSGVGNMAREIIINTAHHYNWVNLGGAVNHPSAGQGADISVDVNTQANITDTDIPDGDTSVNGIYVGSNDTIFLYAMLELSPTALVCFVKYNTSTNTITKMFQVLNGSSFTSEEARLCRWGNDRAIFMFNGNKIRLLVP